MRVLLLCAVATMALSACNQREPTDKAQHADAVRQNPPAASAPTRNVPGGGSGTAASEDQTSGPEPVRGNEAAPPPPAKR